MFGGVGHILLPRSRYTGIICRVKLQVNAGLEQRAAAISLATVKNSEDSTLLAVRNIKRAIRTQRHAIGPSHCIARLLQGRLTSKAAGKHFKIARRFAARKGLK